MNCLTVGHQDREVFCRGVCKTCYITAQRIVNSKQATWEDLEKALVVRGKRVSAIRSQMLQSVKTALAKNGTAVANAQQHSGDASAKQHVAVVAASQTDLIPVGEWVISDGQRLKISCHGKDSEGNQCYELVDKDEVIIEYFARIEDVIRAPGAAFEKGDPVMHGGKLYLVDAVQFAGERVVYHLRNETGERANFVKGEDLKSATGGAGAGGAAAEGGSK